ncbi:MAG: MFS transporter [Nitrospirae bacterium]|nr:MFS transporter [Fimbriimonadaceae bacterium]
MSQDRKATRILVLNTIAFMACFAVWTMYGILVTFLADNRIIPLDKAQIGWLIGTPILTGSLLRLPLGMLTDRFGGRPVYAAVMFFAAASVCSVSLTTDFWGLMVAGLLFGTSGASFAVGVAYSSLWFPRERQGTALGVFGMGNVGAALTTLGAPTLLARLTADGADLEGWRKLPLLYGAVLAVTAVVFLAFTENRKVTVTNQKTWKSSLAPLRQVRVWRFGTYYFLVFGAFVALAQWLVPYYLNVYGMSLATAGLLASVFSLPSGITRALGGWIADKVGARTTMYWVLSGCAMFFLLLVAPRMDLTSPGEGVMAEKAGTVTSVDPDAVVVGETTYRLEPPTSEAHREPEGTLVLPTFESWQEPAVEVGQRVKKKEVLARGVTHVFFQANVWIFTGLVFLAGVMMGVGMGAVYKHIPEYFPNDVGVVGGLVGVIGGLGGFFWPILFGYLLSGSGLWTTCWLVLALMSIGCLVWMHLVILRMGKQQDASTPR